MFKIVMFLTVGLLLLISYYYYGKIKAGRFILKKTLIGTIARKIAPKENSKEYNKVNKKVSAALIDLDIIDLTALKVLLIMFTMILSVSIFITNVNISKNNIINTPLKETVDINSNFNSGFRESNVKLVFKEIGMRNIQDNTYTLYNISNILEKNVPVSKTQLSQLARVTLQDALRIKGLFTPVKLLAYFLFAISGIYIYELGLMLILRVRKKKIDEESKQLMNILTIVLSTSIMPVNSVISMLIDNSTILRGLLQKFFMAYMVNSEEAYNLYLVCTNNKNFEKLIAMLKQVEESDQESAIKAIREQNENAKVLNRLEFENIMQRKDGIA